MHGVKMTMFVGLPVTRHRLVLRVSVLRTLAVGLIGYYMLLPYREKLNACSYIINLLYLKLL